MKFSVLTDQGIREIHNAALGLLEAIGMDIAGDEPRRVLLDAGAKERDGRICIGSELVEQALRQVPENGFEMVGRDGTRRFRVEPGSCRFRPAGGLPFVYDIKSRQRRQATMEDVARIAKVVDALDEIDVANCAASPADIGVGIRNVRRFVSAITYSTKPTDITASGPDEVALVAEIAQIIRGSQEALKGEPLVFVYVSPTSPLRLSEQEALATMECARRGLPLATLSCPTLAATAPVTVAGGVAQEWAEELAQIVLAYAVHPGLPIMACNRIFPADMRTGSSLAEASTTGLAAAAFTEVAAFFGLPSNSWGFASASHLPDLQAGAERMMATMMAALAGPAVISGAGTLGSALVTSPEQLVLDNEIAATVRTMLQGAPVTRETLAVDWMKEGVREGTFLASEHTIAALRSGKLPMADLFTSEPYDTWMSSGKELIDRAHDRVEEILATHEIPELDSTTVKEIEKALSAAGA